jgi:glycosyltransferase involved in cell wall biosynthesis
MKITKPLVSILIPVYNGTPYLEETVESIFASTKLPIEVILVDDGSTDGSKEKCRKLVTRYTHNLKFINFAKNKGMTRCLNAGIKAAGGKYIARINQDDLMIKGRLVKQVKFLESHPDHVAIGSFVQLFTKDNPHYDTISFPTTDIQIKQMWMTLSPLLTLLSCIDGRQCCELKDIAKRCGRQMTCICGTS